LAGFEERKLSEERYYSLLSIITVIHSGQDYRQITDGTNALLYDCYTAKRAIRD